MDYGLQVAGSYEHVAEAARFVKQRGLVAISLPDHYLMGVSENMERTRPAPDAFMQLAGLARDIPDIDLVMLVTPITFRHPAVIAKMAMTLDEMSGGRFTLGIGTGWLDREHEVFGFEYPSMKERFARLGEALAYVTAAFDPEAPGFEGEYYQLEAFPLSPSPIDKIPILVGGTGSHKTPALAGRYGNEFNIYPGPDLTGRLGRFRVAAIEADRDPDEIRLSSGGPIVATETEAEFEDVMNEHASDANISREELDARYEKRDTPRGTYEQVRERLDDLAKLGIQRFYIQGAFTPIDTGRLLRGLGVI